MTYHSAHRSDTRSWIPASAGMTPISDNNHIKNKTSFYAIIFKRSGTALLFTVVILFAFLYLNTAAVFASQIKTLRYNYTYTAP